MTNSKRPARDQLAPPSNDVFAEMLSLAESVDSSPARPESPFLPASPPAWPPAPAQTTAMGGPSTVPHPHLPPGQFPGYFPPPYPFQPQPGFPAGIPSPYAPYGGGAPVASGSPAPYPLQPTVTAPSQGAVNVPTRSATSPRPVAPAPAPPAPASPSAAPPRHAQPQPAAVENLQKSQTIPPVDAPPLESDTSGSGLAIRVVCSCGRRLRILRQKAGQTVRCPKCRAEIAVPMLDAEQAESNSERANPIEIKTSFRQLATRIERQTAPPDLPPVPSKKTLSVFRFQKLKRLVTPPKSEKVSARTKEEDHREALLELGKSRDVRAKEFLVHALGSESVRIREAATIALGEFRDATCAGLIVAVLDDNASEVRRAAVATLGKLGDRRVTRPLLQLGLDEPHYRFAVADAVCQLESRAVPALLDLLSDSEPGIVLESIVLLGRLKDKRAVKSLLAVIDSKSDIFQAHAAESLGAIGDARSLGMLYGLLEHRSVGVRMAAASAIVKIPNSQNVRPLIDALDDEDLDVRALAATALGEIGDARAAEKLCEQLAIPNDDLRVAVAEALGRIGDGRALSPLLQLLQSDNETVLLKAITALRRISDPQAIEGLLPLLDHPREPVKLRTIDTLGQIGDAPVAERLEAILTRSRSDAQRAAAAKALGEIGDPASIESLIDALGDEFPVRCRAIVALGQIQDETALAPLLAQLKDPLPEVRFHAANALGELGQASAMTTLEPMLADESHMVRRGVAKALQRLGHPRGQELVEKGADPNAVLVESNQARAKRSLNMGGALSFLWPPTMGQRLMLLGTLTCLIITVGLLFFRKPTISAGRIFSRGNLQTLTISADGKELLAAQSMSVLEIWEVETNRLRIQIRGSARKTVFGKSAEIAFLCTGAEVRIWNTAEAVVGEPVKVHRKPIVDVVRLPTGAEVLTLDASGLLVRWDAATGRMGEKIELPSASSASIFRISPDGTYVAGGTAQGSLLLWNAVDGQPLRELSGGRAAVTAIAFSPDAKQVAAAVDGGNIVLWNCEKQRPVTTWTTTTLKVKYTQLEFRPGETVQLLGVVESVATLWDVSGTQLRQFQPDDLTTIQGAKFSEDGRRLALGGDPRPTVSLFDVETGKLLKKLDTPAN